MEKKPELSNLFVDDQGHIRMVDNNYYCFVEGIYGPALGAAYRKVYWTIKLISK